MPEGVLVDTRQLFPRGLQEIVVYSKLFAILINIKRARPQISLSESPESILAFLEKIFKSFFNLKRLQSLIALQI